MVNNLKVRLVQRKVLEGTDAASLQTALDAWFATAEEKTLIDTFFAGSGSSFVVIIFYTVG